MVEPRVLSCLVLAGWMCLSSPGLSQGLNHDIPAHAHYSPTDQGWTCNSGFTQVAQFCVSDAESAASRGISEVFDKGWRCRSGYSQAKGFCLPVGLPPHASPVGPGDRWECDWGYRRVGARCEEIEPPAHGYLEASGHSWACFPGYERVQEHCEPPSGLEQPPADQPTR
jgi:hypothetical protein